jgi:thiol:disulfide interchange protein DsbD
MPRCSAFVTCLAALVGAAGLGLYVGAADAQLKLLPAEDAFRFSARALDSRTVEASFAIADGYYLYREKLAFSTPTPGAALGPVSLPSGKVKEDRFFGRVETYRGRVVVPLAVENAAPGLEVTLRADSQGCADAGVCYPPNAQSITLTLPQPGGPPGPLIDATPPRKRWFN